MLMLVNSVVLVVFFVREVSATRGCQKNKFVYRKFRASSSAGCTGAKHVVNTHVQHFVNPAAVQKFATIRKMEPSLGSKSARPPSVSRLRQPFHQQRGGCASLGATPNTKHPSHRRRRPRLKYVWTSWSWRLCRSSRM